MRKEQRVGRPGSECVLLQSEERSNKRTVAIVPAGCLTCWDSKGLSRRSSTCHDGYYALENICEHETHCSFFGMFFMRHGHVGKHAGNSTKFTDSLSM